MNETIIMPYKETHVSKKDGYKSFFFLNRSFCRPQKKISNRVCKKQIRPTHPKIESERLKQIIYWITFYFRMNELREQITTNY